MGYHTIRNNTITNNTIGINSPKQVTTIMYNNIHDNAQFNIFLDDYCVNTPSAPSNWWGTTDIDAINQTLNIKGNPPNTIKLFFIPILLEPNTQAPAMQLQPTTSPTPTSSPTPTQQATSTPATSPPLQSSQSPSTTSPSPSVPEFPNTAILSLFLLTVSAACVIFGKYRKNADYLELI